MESYTDPRAIEALQRGAARGWAAVLRSEGYDSVEVRIPGEADNRPRRSPLDAQSGWLEPDSDEPKKGDPGWEGKGATVKELQALARDRGIKGFSKLDKAALIERLSGSRDDADGGPKGKGS